MAQAFERKKLSPIEKLLLIGAVVLITCLAFEALATTNAMPTVVGDLGGDRWYSLAAGMVLAGQIISTTISGWWTDKSGVGRPLIYGMTLFSAGALAAGLAPSLAVFITGRAVQGLGAGMIMVPLYVMVGSVVAVERRPLFFAVFSFAWVLPSMIGPSIAGYIVQHWSWRPVFWFIVPIALVAIIPLFPILKRMPQADPQHMSPPPALFSALLTSAGIVALQIAGGLANLGMALATIMGLLLLGFGMPKLLPEGTFGALPGVPAIVAMRTSMMGALIGAEFFLPLVLDRVHGWTPAQTGWAIALGSITWTLGSWLQSKVALWQKRTKIPTYGSAMLAGGALLVLTMPIASIPTYISLTGFATMGLGLGLAHSTSSDLALGVTPKHKHGDVSASLQLADALGPALAMGVSSVALTGWSHIGGGTSPYLPASLISVMLATVALLSSIRIIGAKRLASL